MTTWTGESVISSAKEIPIVEDVILQAHDRDTGYKAIVDKTTMRTICIVKQDHQFIQHQNVYQELAKVPEYKIVDAYLLQDGITLMVDIIERTPRTKEFLPDDVFECWARITNSYDKTRGLSISGMALRLVCKNGNIAPKLSKKMKVEAFGTSEFANEMRMKIQTCLEIWSDSKVSDLINRATTTKVDTMVAIEKNHFLPKTQMEIIVGKLKNEETVYNIWNEYTRVIMHEFPVKREIIYQMQRKANKILKLAIVPEEE